MYHLLQHNTFFFVVQFEVNCIEVCFYCTIQLNVLLVSWDGIQDLWMWLAVACAIASFISWLTLTMRVASFPGSSLVFSLWQVARHSLGGFSKPTLLSRLILESLKLLFSEPHDLIKYGTVIEIIGVYYSRLISIIYYVHILYCSLWVGQ